MPRKYIYLIGGFCVVLAIALFGYIFITARGSSKPDATAKPVAQQSDSSGLSGNQAPIQSDASNGLNIYSSSGSAASQTPAASSSTGAAAQTIDPSTFSQYDKYKNETSALFGDIQVGTGAEIASGQNVAVYYKGWLTNGQLFDQTRNDADGKLQPYVFSYGAHQVITGWEQAMAGMKVGGSRLLIIPPSVGYGDTAQGSIPPNSVLVFQVQLVAAQ